MDLVAYAQKTFDQIKEDIAHLIKSQNTKDLTVFSFHFQHLNKIISFWKVGKWDSIQAKNFSM